MAFLKRPEIWVLLLLSAVGAGWVLWSDRQHDARLSEPDKASAEPNEKAGTPSETSHRFAIRERRVSREDDHLIVTLQVVVENSIEIKKTMDLSDPTARLVTEDGTAIRRFFLPFDPPPTLGTGMGTFCELRYWLPVSQAHTALWLEVDGDRLAVKAASPEDEENDHWAIQLPEGIEVGMTGTTGTPDHSTIAMANEFLLINNNNTRTKFARATGRDLDESDHRVIETASLTGAAIAETLKGWQFEKVVVASVVPEKGELIRRQLSTDFPLLEISHEVNLGIAIDFPDPRSVGADRLANAAAVVAFHHAPAIVVDFGTAVTFDIVADGVAPAYVGGVIAPGLDVMRDYLHQRTALLPRIDIEEPPAAIGKSTIDAMLSGAVHGYRGLVREILEQVSVELGSNSPPKVIATGGYADLIAAGLHEIELVDPFLTLRGLAAVGTLNSF